MRENHSYFPLFLSMEEKRFLFIGGGKVTARRLSALFSVLQEGNGTKITVVSPKVLKEVETLESQGKLLWIKREFSDKDVENMDFVIAAADDISVNERAVKICREKGILVNDAGKKENCDFYFPAIAKKNDLIAGIIASGKNHKLAAKAGEAVRSLFGKITEEQDL